MGLGRDPLVTMPMPSSLGFLFPSQGSQFVGMGKDLYEQESSAREIFDQADPILGHSIKKICFEGPEEELTRTENAQPAIFVTSLAALAVLKAKFPDLKPDFVAGLSLGEFTALVAAGSISFEEGLRLVQKRALAMESCAKKYPGTMASLIGFALTDCESAAKEAGCEVANLNSPDQIVISGTHESVEKACQLAEARGAKRAIRLKVGGAFHSRLMMEARKDLESAIASTKVQAPFCTFIPNARARPVSEPAEIRRLLAEQLTRPVRWSETMRKAAEGKISLFLEVGPGKVLKGLARKTSPEINVEPCGTTGDLQKIEQLFVSAS